MTPLRPSKHLAIAAGLGLLLGVPAGASAQVDPGNANLSTGSGAGTSPGVSPGSSPSSTNINRSGMSYPSPGYTREGLGRPPQGSILGGGAEDGRQGGAGERGGLPDALGGYGGLYRGLYGSDRLSQAELDAIDARALEVVRGLTVPADRASAMDRVAEAKITAHQPGDGRLDDAQAAITEGGQAALQVQDPTTRDIRLRLLVRTALSLADERTREAMTNTSDPTVVQDSTGWPLRRRVDWLVQAENARHKAADLALKIDNGSLRSEMLFHVVDSESLGSQAIQSEVLLAQTRRSDLSGMTDALHRMADRSLVFAANDAGRIDKPIWRDRGMVSIAMAAAASEQFERGVEISRTIPQPEYRSEALIRLAESQARRNRPDEATRTYDLAARAVASIPLEDPRATLASVLIDSLLAVGRFDDARACVPFYPDAVRRREALGAIAENQGERRLVQSAFAWIDRDAPPELRDMLRLRVSEGVLRAVERTRLNQVGYGGNQVR